MSDEYKETKKKQRNSSVSATVFLVLSMAIMALWGWTPLKKIIPGVYVLIIFLVFLVCSIALTLMSIYRGIQARAEKARTEDA